MTVAQLIDQLKKMDPNATVFIDHTSLKMAELIQEIWDDSYDGMKFVYLGEKPY